MYIHLLTNFFTVLTNVVFWLLIFYVSLWTLKGTMFLVDLIKARIEAKRSADATQRPLQTPEPPSPIELTTPARWDAVRTEFDLDKNKNDEEPTDSKASSGLDGSDNTSDESSYSLRNINWLRIATQYPSVLSFFLIFAVGAPIAAGTGDSRALDGFATWFFWISAVRGQRLFKQSKLFPKNPRYKSAISTLLNPVLMTVFLLLAYTRAKASALGVSVKWVLDEFSQGSPLYELWTAGVTGEVIRTNPTSYFGAGDLALSILEVGILIWGFKLYECRRQLFSTAGIVTVLISAIAAATNVFVCVLLGVALKIKAPEALAFAARSTTLALAKPAIEAVGGNVPANAGLVVANGILGQLIYPFALSRIGVKKKADAKDVEQKNEAEAKALLNQGPAEADRAVSPTPSPTATKDEADDAVTIAAGIAIGINGAAMGVAYLVENRSRAAPYAALAMTIFGVFTVVFTSVEPFKMAVIGLANLDVPT